MNVVGKKVLKDLIESYPECRASVLAWIAEAESATWLTPIDVKNRYPKASVIGGKRYVFNIMGNRYRLDAKIDFQNAVVLVKRAGSHTEYDGWRFE